MGSKCSRCEAGRCRECDSPATCSCKCNVGGGHDIAQKTAAIAGGAAVVAGGVALTIVTGGVAGLVLGGVLVGAGASSSVNGATKAIKGEKMTAEEYLIDVGIGAATGVLTGGVGGAGEAVAASLTKNMIKEGLKVGATKLGVRAATGAVSGVVSKAASETITCATTDKKWGENASAGDWVASAALGVIGGSFSHATSNAANAAGSAVVENIGSQPGLVGAVKGGVRVVGGAVEGTTIGIVDAGIKKVSGKDFQGGEIAIAAIASATQAGICHSGRQVGHAINTSINGHHHNKNYKYSRKSIKKIKDGIKKQGDTHNGDEAAVVSTDIQALDYRNTVEDVGDILVNAYTNDSYLYKDMNGMLRSGDSAGHNLEPAARALNEHLLLQGKKQNTTWRGTNIAETNPNQQVTKLKVAEEISFPSFTSTSTDRGAAQTFADRGSGKRVLMQVEGNSGVDISQKSYFKHEGEVLYPAGSKFRCTEQRVVGNEVQLKLVQTETPKPSMGHELRAPYQPPQHWNEQSATKRTRR